MKAQRVGLFICPMATPADTKGLQELADSGKVKPDTLVALVGKTEGTGFVAAVDSADSNSHEPYQASQRRAYQGRCLALIKANAARGRIKLTATSPNLTSASLLLTVSPSSGRR